MPDARAASKIMGTFLGDDLLNTTVLTAVDRLRPIAKEAGLSMAQLAVAWVLQNPAVSAAIVGATRPEQVREKLQRDIDDAGLNYLLTRFAFGDLTQDEAKNSVNLFTSPVMPDLRPAKGLV